MPSSLNPLPFCLRTAVTVDLILAGRASCTSSISSSERAMVADSTKEGARSRIGAKCTTVLTLFLQLLSLPSAPSQLRLEGTITLDNLEHQDQPCLPLLQLPGVAIEHPSLRPASSMYIIDESTVHMLQQHAQVVAQMILCTSALFQWHVEHMPKDDEPCHTMPCSPRSVSRGHLLGFPAFF